MLDTGNKGSPRKGIPTEKMIAAAVSTSARHGVQLPEGYESDFAVCKSFLDKFLAMPTSKAVAFAQLIAADKGLEIPTEALNSGKALSAWIDAHRTV